MYQCGNCVDDGIRNRKFSLCENHIVNFAPVRDSYYNKWSLHGSLKFLAAIILEIFISTAFAARAESEGCSYTSQNNNRQTSQQVEFLVNENYRKCHRVMNPFREVQRVKSILHSSTLPQCFQSYIFYKDKLILEQNASIRIVYMMYLSSS